MIGRILAGWRGRTAKPVVVPSKPKASPVKILLVAYYSPNGLGTIVDYISQITQWSRFNYDVLNLAWNGPLEIPAEVDYYSYTAIMIHPTMSYDAENLVNLDRGHPRKIEEFPGLKIMMKQDEHHKTDEVVSYLQKNQFQLLCTCVPPQETEKVYPKEKLPNLRLFYALTGYVSDSMKAFKYGQDEDRPIDIGYRGSPQPWWFGRLSYEKYEIGEVFRRVCAKKGLRADISSRWEDRFFGQDWFDFLGRCKATPGVESGASVFDFTGRIEKDCQEYLKAHPEADFEEVYAEILAPYEGNVYYNQISPRHFEAAACRTLQILYEGEYSGIFQPYRHYLPLQRDLGNLDDVINRFMDREERKRITESAFDEIIVNDEYSYKRFVQRLDDAIENLL